MFVSKASLRSADWHPEVILELGEYLDAIGLSNSPQADAAVRCEICGSADAEQVRGSVRVTAEVGVRFVVSSCLRCGLLYQTPRFAPAFYRSYYSRIYRTLNSGDSRPTADYVADQIARGAALAESLVDWLPLRGWILDVGCAAGGLMKPFLDKGWNGLGIDPDVSAVEYGAKVLELPVVVQAAEDLETEAERFNLIVITGSLEHVYEPNSVLRRCWRAGAPGSLLLLEGHGLGQATLVGALGHNHRRFLTGNSLELLMLKHGWIPELVTSRALCGPTRPGSVFALGRRAEPMSSEALDAVINEGRRETPDELRAMLEYAAIA